MTDPTAAAAAEPGGPAGAEVLYVSWGGTGRGTALRGAIERAHSMGAGFTLLAVLDDRRFRGIEGSLANAVVDELAWLLRAQVSMVGRQLGATDLRTHVMVRSGSIEDEIGRCVAERGPSLVLLGAPSDSGPDRAAAAGLADMASDLGRTTSVPVEVV